MIIVIDLTQRTKDELEKLLELGGYRSYSEAVAVAIANQLVLQRHAVRTETDEPSGTLTKSPYPMAQENGEPLPTQMPNTLQVPLLFSHLGTEIKIPKFVAYPNRSSAIGQAPSVDQWIFGQHNKLLPVKATCRALARFQSVGAHENSALRKTASEIASEAVKLGDYLRRLDVTSGVHRDDALSFGFPYSDSPNGDKSRLRYANQFVVSFTKQGTLAGLPFELELINRDQARIPQVLLTEAGWLFASMRNPILDDGKDGRQGKFYDQEAEFLHAHIRDRVPAEAFAYRLVLEAIARGANTPDKLDDTLDEYLPKRVEKPFTRAFLTTQRAGVISRMIDLGLVQRIRDGINVTYTATATTFESSPNLLFQAI